MSLNMSTLIHVVISLPDVTSYGNSLEHIFNIKWLLEMDTEYIHVNTCKLILADVLGFGSLCDTTAHNEITSSFNICVLSFIKIVKICLAEYFCLLTVTYLLISWTQTRTYSDSVPERFFFKS